MNNFMHLITRLWYLTWLMLILLMMILPVSLSDPQTTLAELTCGQNPSPIPNNSYYPVFVQAMEGVLHLVTNYTWGFYSAKATDISVYALAQCYQDLTQTDCVQCYAAACARIPGCLPSDAARLHLDGCFLRYDTYDFATESVDQSKDAAFCGRIAEVSAASGGDGFWNDAEGLIDNLTRKAESSGGYAIEGLRGVYGLAQCWKSLNSSGCEECLTKASKEVKTCLPVHEGRALNAGCYLRYSNEKFYDDPRQDTGGSGGNSRARTIISVTTVFSVVLVLIFVSCILCKWRNRGRDGRTSRDVEQRYIFKDVIAQGGSSEVPSFSLQSIEVATNNFSTTNKLGQGGFGPVYKGKLSNGQEIAVKRLSKSSGQGAEEFKNEVLLLFKVQHRNLVKILGFCVKREERMLVYEYMPNNSLDKLIFGSVENGVLDWSLRYKIIEGIARGLLYLHRDSRLKIIHRDLKTSNILLDEHMNPKISDFGLARIFEGDQSSVNTNRVVGTYGYMSPEYAMQEIFSEKSDVFSFGVLLLEVLSGKRNNGFHHSGNPQNLLSYAWQLWKDGRPFELLDPKFNSLYNPSQVDKCIHVALLCVQEHATNRPTMSIVVSMLCNETSLPSPERPAFGSNGRLDESNPYLPKSFMCSRNDISLTSIHGR